MILRQLGKKKNHKVASSNLAFSSNYDNGNSEEII